MSDAIFYPYRAFISYSHADSARCDWLHGKLESYRVARDLVGRITEAGPVPERLAPVFRDRTDFSTGSLQKQTLDALRQSQFLIVIASPRAAASEYVNEEIRAFKAMGGATKVCALIADGEPPDCFPPALRFRVDADGAITDEKEDVLAGDLVKDGEREALIKIVAALIRLPYDYVWMRDVQTQRKRTIVYAGAGAVFAVAVAAAGIFGWGHYGLRQDLARDEQTLAKNVRDTEANRVLTADLQKQVQELKAQLLSVATAQAAPGRDRAVEQAAESYVKSADAGDPEARKAVALLQAGRLDAAVSADEQEAQRLEATSRDNARKAAAIWRRAGAIAGLRDPKKAREAYAKAVELEPDNAEALYWNGWFQFDAGDLTAAEKSYAALLAHKDANDDKRIWTHFGLGDIWKARGDLVAALEAFRDGLAIADRLAKADPSNSGWQRNLSVSFINIGDVLVAQGNLPDALKSFRDSLTIADRLAKSDLGNARWWFVLGLSNERIAEVLVAQGKLDEALKYYRKKFEIIDRLAKNDPGNSALQRDLFVSFNKIGDVLVAQGDLTGALEHFRDSLAIADSLARSDPRNAGRQFDLGISNERIAGVLAAQGKLDEALKYYRKKFEIIDRLAKTDPGNSAWQRDLSVSVNKIGGVLVAQGNLPDALKNFRDSLAIRDRLAKADPGNAQWQRDLSVSYEQIGEMLRRQGDTAGAIAALESALAAYQLLIAAHPDDTKSLVLSVVPHWGLAALGKDTQKNLEAALAILEPLAAAKRLDATRTKWIPMIREQLGAPAK